MKLLQSVAPLALRYDTFIIDLWGVIHDGQTPYPQARDCLSSLKEKGKTVIFLSNAPRRAHAVAEVLRRMDITESLYDKIVTSGEVFYRHLAHPEESFFKPNGRHYLYIGLEKDRKILEGLHYEETKHPEFAQFILLSHSFFDNQPMKEIYPLLRECMQYKLPMLCINPDREIVRLNGERVYCAGVIGEEYRMMGGEVFYIGKPHRAVYEACLEGIAVDKKRIVAIGDNLKTDIAGALRTGLASVLITGGILKKETEHTKHDSEPALHKLLQEEAVEPDFVIPAFAWDA